MDYHFKFAKTLTHLLDKNFKFLGFRFGLDPILGLVPILGDLVSLLLSLYIVWIGIQLRVPREIITRMISNVVFDFTLGLIPVVGDLADFLYKANSRNLDLLEKYAPIRGQVLKI